jgi:hypothetical protein
VEFGQNGNLENNMKDWITGNWIDYENKQESIMYKTRTMAEAERIGDALDVVADGGWIPVSERLPEEFKPVCISGKPYDNYGHLQALAFLAGTRWEFLDDSFNWYDFGVLEGEAPQSKGELDEAEAIYITHWMPLPDPPKQDA